MIDQDARQYDIASLDNLYPVSWVEELYTAVRLEAGYRISHGPPRGFPVPYMVELARRITLDHERKGRLDRMCSVAVQFHPDREVQP